MHDLQLKAEYDFDCSAYFLNIGSVEQTQYHAILHSV